MRKIERIMQIFKDLNPAQLAAVEYLEGAQMIVAGAGSGKTKVLTYKIAYLLKKDFSPESIPVSYTHLTLPTSDLV